MEALKQLSHDTRDFIGDAVATLQAPIDPCTFLRQYVCTNTPVVLKGVTEHWPASRLWSREYLTSKAGSTEVSVELTPNGLGDAVTGYEAAGGQQQCFCMPHTSRMSFGEFVTMFFATKEQQQSEQPTASSRPVIPYLSQQNSNLTQELPQLLEDVDEQLDFAAAAFGAAPDATNIWIGDERATTSFHKDHYENLYCVVRGTKVFHLLPPTEVYRMGLKQYPAARYEPQEDGRLLPVLLQPPSSVPWSPIHPEPDNIDDAAAQHPLFFDPNLPPPLRVEVHAGEVLYLPAMWWHYVEQRACPQQGWCVAVNYWYDMQFDSRYATFKLVESLMHPAQAEQDDVVSEQNGGEDLAAGPERKVVKHKRGAGGPCGL